MARDFAAGLVVIVDAPQVIAAGHRRQRAVERQQLHAVARQIEVADDLGPQQRHNVGSDGELEAGKNLFGDGGAAEHMTPLEHQHLASGARQIRRAGQAVVPAPDHDRVVTHRLNYPSSSRQPQTSGKPGKYTFVVPVASAFHARTLQLCESLNYRDWAGYYAVSAYETHHEHEYNAIRNACALIDISPLFKYRLSGPDAMRLVNRVITRDASKMAIGQVYYTPWCDEYGKVIDDGTVTRTGRVGIPVDRRRSEPALVVRERLGPRRRHRGHLRKRGRAGAAGADVEAAAAAGV